MADLTREQIQAPGVPDSTQGDGALPRDQSGAAGGDTGPGLRERAEWWPTDEQVKAFRASSYDHGLDGFENARLLLRNAHRVLSETGLPGPEWEQVGFRCDRVDHHNDVLRPDPVRDCCFPVFRRVPSPTPEAE